MTLLARTTFAVSASLLLWRLCAPRTNFNFKQQLRHRKAQEVPVNPIDIPGDLNWHATNVPSGAPSLSSAPSDSVAPSLAASIAPSMAPVAPKVTPTMAPSSTPSRSSFPSVARSMVPSIAPSLSLAPSDAPTIAPTTLRQGEVAALQASAKANQEAAESLFAMAETMAKTSQDIAEELQEDIETKKALVNATETVADAAQVNAKANTATAVFTEDISDNTEKMWTLKAFGVVVGAMALFAWRSTCATRASSQECHALVRQSNVIACEAVHDHIGNARAQTLTAAKANRPKGCCNHVRAACGGNRSRKLILLLL